MHITHDLSACLKADQVILFEDGKNVESGTHEALLADPDSKYRLFYNASLGREYEGSDQEDDSDNDADIEESDTENTEAESSSEAGSTPDNPTFFLMHLSPLGESPELYARIEEISEDIEEEQEILDVVDEQKDQREDEANDSGFEASSQANFPERISSVPTDCQATNSKP